MYPLNATKELKKLMRDYFTSLGNGEGKVAWCTSVGPAELLRSFGFKVYFPENHGALLGASRTAMDYIPEAAKYGYSNHVCSYTTGDIGAYIAGQTPLMQQYGLKSIPKPDLIVYNTNQCREVQDWFHFFGKEFNCPVAGIHPPRHVHEVTKGEIELVISQHKEIIPACEIASGKNLILTVSGKP